MPTASLGRAFLFTCLIASALGAAFSAQTASAQSETRERQAAAEAYDQGTASYLSGDYARAAEWFETAHRLSPAAPALIQAARAHQQAGHLTRAATLSLRLQREYPNDANAVQFAQGVLDQLAGRFVRVEVTCANCNLDVDGSLQESPIFFVDPGVPHSVTASFETGERRQDVQGEAGSVRRLSFEAPPPPPTPPAGATEASGAAAVTHKPLAPIVTWVAGGVTAALLAGSIVSSVDTQSGVKSYEDAAAQRNACLMAMDPNVDCQQLYAVAHAKLDRGQSKETRTNILWISTGVAAAATAVIGLLFTDWSGDSNSGAEKQALQVGFGATPTGGGVVLKGAL